MPQLSEFSWLISLFIWFFLFLMIFMFVMYNIKFPSTKIMKFSFIYYFKLIF